MKVLHLSSLFRKGNNVNTNVQNISTQRKGFNKAKHGEHLTTKYRRVYIYIYIYISSSSSSSSSSCRATGTDIPDPLSLLLPIVHRLWQVFRATSRILT